MSERTLHRRLAEQGKTFQTITSDAQKNAAESVLVKAAHLWRRWRS